jgi:hypothetical protein
MRFKFDKNPGVYFCIPTIAFTNWSRDLYEIVIAFYKYGLIIEIKR